MTHQEPADKPDDGFRKVFQAVHAEWARAWFRHEELQVLYGTQETCDLINAVAPEFFGDVQKLFWNDLMLRVARLVDKGRRTIRVQSLERHIKDDPDLLSFVKEQREAATTAAKPILDRRHRVIAHLDREYVISDSAQPLETVRLETCKRVLDHVHSALNAVSLAKMDSGIVNHVMPARRPISGTLLAYLGGLVNGVRFVAEIINPEDPDGFDLSRGREFLATLGRSGRDDESRIFDLMDLARSIGKRLPSS